MTTHTAIEDADAISPSDCWCCGRHQPPEKMVHLGNHPEVAICVRCAYSVKNWAWEIEDQSRTGLLVRQRDRLRHARKLAMRKGWHQHPILGRPVRWLGRRLP
jgi:hypothetical protein